MPKKIQFEEILSKVYSIDDFDYSAVEHGAKLKNCVLCGKEFYGLGRNSYFQKICNRTHYVNCFI